MKLEFGSASTTRHGTCEVCGLALSFHDQLQNQGLGYAVCRSFDCRRVMQQKPSMHPQLFNAHLKFQQNRIQHSRSLLAKKQQRIDETLSRQQQEHEQIIEQVLNEQPGLSRQQLDLVVIPRGKKRSSRPARQRIEHYQEHLQAIINEACSYSSNEEVVHDQHYSAHDKLISVELGFANNPGSREISQHCCSRCRGGCCVSGQEHAYLSAYTMRSLMDRAPYLTSSDLLKLYTNHLADNTIEQSCINHTSTGCALPRELRSDICNAFFCDPVKNLLNQDKQQRTSKALLIIQRADSYSSWLEPDAENDIVGYQVVQTDELDFNEIDATAVARPKSSAGQ